MPFPLQVNWAFTETGIASLPAGQSGIYGISRPDRWIYVGQAHDIRARLLEHLRKQSTESACIHSHGPASWQAEIAAASQLNAREATLIHELRPVCNKLG
jgi:excinuclease UvrABC nuclease subunit